MVILKKNPRNALEALRHQICLLLFILFPLFLWSQENSSANLKRGKSSFNENIVDSGKLIEGIFYEKVVIDGSKYRLPFYLFTNKNSGKYVLLLHGLGGSKMDWIYPSYPYFAYTKNLKAIKDTLLYLGYNVLIPDAMFHGERRYESDFEPVEKIPPLSHKSPSDGQIFNEMMEGSIADFRRIFDYIEKRDSLAKFDVIGYSMGGAIALILNSVDNRISSVAACVPPLNHPAKEIIDNTWHSTLTSGLNYHSAYNHAKEQTAPVALFMGKEDFFYSPDEVRLFYEKMPVKNKQLKYYDSGHELPGEFVKDVIAWIISNSSTK